MPGHPQPTTYMPASVIRGQAAADQPCAVHLTHRATSLRPGHTQRFDGIESTRRRDVKSGASRVRIDSLVLTEFADPSWNYSINHWSMSEPWLDESDRHGYKETM